MPVRIEPSQHLLDIWKATVAASWRDGAWHWGGRDGANSISDAEQLLCILRPATTVPAFALDSPNTTGGVMLDALGALGDERSIPMRLVEIATEYFRRYADATGRPLFAGGSYFRAADGDRLTDDRRDHDVVDSFAISVTLSLATIGFVRTFRQFVTRQEFRQRLRALEELAGARLTAAMVGLLRSFSVTVFAVDSPAGETLLRTLDTSGRSLERLAGELRSALRETIASFGEVLIGSGQTNELDGDDTLFECGWSWGVVDHAPPVELDPNSEKIGPQPDGVAEDKPYLYFTVVAVDAIEDLFAERTRVLGLLNSEQQRLARALQLRWDLTLTYWSTVATFGPGPAWPLEDGLSSAHHTLLMTSLVVKDLARRRGSDTRPARVGVILTGLADEGRITRTHRSGDSGVRLHAPGLTIVLGTPESPETPALWVAGEFAPLLLRHTIVVAGLLTDVDERVRLLRLADRIWDHLSRRRLGGLWDQPSGVFEDSDVHTEPSWHYTERVVQCLVSTANMLSGERLADEQLVRQARKMLSEAEEHL